MKQPKFYVGQSVVVHRGGKTEMYAISRASIENDNWIYYSVEGAEVTYLHDSDIVLYHHEGEWHANNGGEPPVVELKFV